MRLPPFPRQVGVAGGEGFIFFRGVSAGKLSHSSIKPPPVTVQATLIKPSGSHTKRRQESIGGGGLLKRKKDFSGRRREMRGVMVKITKSHYIHT